MPPRYVPKQGDVVYLTFDPQSGHEQKGRRPALVISHLAFNRATGLAIVCPITRTDKSIPFHVRLSLAQKDVAGFVMTEQIKSIDYHARKVQKYSTVSQETLNEVLAILDACIY